MKRYWFSIVLVIFILGSVGTYYVAAAARSFPEYRLLTVSGDDNEAKSLVLQGDTKEYGSIDINAKGSSYFQEKSFLGSIFSNERFKYSPDLQQMMKEHKNFMRGKKTDNGFYQDNDVLAYADVQIGKDIVNRTYRLNISVLNLKSNDKINFSAVLPKQENYSWVSTSDVQVKGQTLTLITYNVKKATSSQQNEPTQEIHAYMIDLNKKSIVEDRVLLADERLDDGRIVTYSILPSSQYSAPAESLAYQQMTQTFVKDKDGNESLESWEQSIFTYNLASGKSESVPALSSSSKDESADSGGPQAYVSQGSIIELVKEGADSLVKVYSNSDKTNREFRIPVTETLNTLVYGDRLYTMTHDDDTTKVVIADLRQGKVVYTGAVDINEQGKKRAELLKKLSIYAMYMTK